jgi:D-alanine-D-alanine ligase
VKTVRVLTLVHKGLVPPDSPAPEDIPNAEWKMEWDVVSTLRKSGHELQVIAADDDLTPIRHALEQFKPRIVFNLMEAFANIGVFDQNVVSYLELLRAPYTGCNPRGLTLSRDKALAKKLMAYHRIPVPDFTVVPRDRRPVLPKRLRFPLIVKSLLYESSTGISQASVVENEEQLARRVQFIHDTIGTAAIVEQFVDGRELYVGVMGNARLQVFPVWEMSFAKMPEHTWRIATERVKWSVKYQKKHGIDTAEADLPEGLAPRVQHIAKRVYRALDLTGYARIDMRMDAQGKLFVIEANANPQLAQGEDFAESARRAGVSYDRLLDRIMALGLQWQPSRMAWSAEPEVKVREGGQRRK